MRSVFFILALCSPANAIAADGQLGPMSQGSVHITVSVAPRVWQIDAGSKPGELCVAIGGGFEIVEQASGQPAKWRGASSYCDFGGRPVQVELDQRDGFTLILLRPE